MNYSVTNFDLEDIFGDECLVIDYETLQKLISLREIFKKVKYLFVLYNWDGNYGHWTCLFLREDEKDAVEFFDPIGYKPDHELFSIPLTTRLENGMGFPIINKLLMDFDGIVHYNQYKLQKEKDGITTCGRWCIARCLNSDMSLSEFAEMFKSKSKTTDEMVTEYTQPLFNYLQEI